MAHYMKYLCQESVPYASLCWQRGKSRLRDEISWLLAQNTQYNPTSTLKEKMLRETRAESLNCPRTLLPIVSTQKYLAAKAMTGATLALPPRSLSQNRQGPRVMNPETSEVGLS
ncbi:hypothetical protein GH733_007476 [Mirounga leonina]|nr:hypothetical protein GH733_007476 [Mirounga leonina]